MRTFMSHLILILEIFSAKIIYSAFTLTVLTNFYFGNVLVANGTWSNSAMCLFTHHCSLQREKKHNNDEVLSIIIMSFKALDS